MEELKIEVEKRRPLEKFYVPLGEHKGVQFTLWPNSLQLTRTEKNSETGKWETKQEFNLAQSVLKELNWRIPGMLDRIKEIDRMEKTEHAS